MVIVKSTEGFLGYSAYRDNGYMGMLTWLKFIELQTHDLYALKRMVNLKFFLTIKTSSCEPCRFLSNIR